MRLARLTVSTATLLLSTTAAFAQQGATTYENVFIDVGGTPIQVPVALATETCGLDEAGVQQAALSRQETSGIDEATMQELMAATAPAGTMDATGTATADTSGTAATGDMATTDTTTADAVDAAGTTDAATGAASTPAPGGEPASTTGTDMAAASTPAPGGEPASTDMAASGNAATDDMSGVLEGAETTAADTTAMPNGGTTAAQGLDSDANAQMLALAVCQVDVTRASELGITGVGDGTTTGADTAGTGG